MSTQVPFELLLENKVYREWLKAVPKAPVLAHSGLPWRVWAQRELGGRWAFKDFSSYQKAFNWLVRNRREFWDMALTCKVRQFKPPVVRVRDPLHPKVVTRHFWPGVEGHRWCGFCRRPTLFKYFTKHHAVRKDILIPGDRRCCVCGAREKYLKYYHTTLTPTIPWGQKEDDEE